MPNYDFVDDRTGKIKTLFFHMNDNKIYIGDDGYEWRRLFSIPCAAIDTQWDANNPRDFVEKTAKRKGTIKNLWDKSAELSERRAKERGKDDVKETYYKNYQKRRNNRVEHPDVKKKKLKDELAKKNIQIEF